MTLTLVFILALALFIVLMAFWVVRTEDAPKKENSYLDPTKSYNKAKQLGLNFPNQYDDVLPGV